VIGEILSATMLAQTLRSSVPYVGAALGGAVSERSGVINIALEGILLSSSLASVAVAFATKSVWAGVAAGVLVGALVGLVHAWLVERGRVHAIVSGVAINLVAAGATRVVLRVLYDSSSNSPSIDGFHSTASSGFGLVWRALVDPLVLLTFGAAVGTVVLLDRTRFGLRLRACGEAPTAAAHAGVRVPQLRMAAVALGGALCGLGGVALAYDQRQFQSGMSGGRGFIALAAVVVAGWRPGRAALACLVFAFLDALQIVLQARAAALHDVLQMLPYVATLLVLALLARRAPSGSGRAPRGLGVTAEGQG
jgi:simple sugar transport system permease protein